MSKQSSGTPNVDEEGACGVADEQLAVSSEVVVTPKHHWDPAQSNLSVHARQCNISASCSPPSAPSQTLRHTTAVVRLSPSGRTSTRAAGSVLPAQCAPPEASSVSADSEQVGAGLPAGPASGLAAAHVVDEHQAGAVAAEQRLVDPPYAPLVVSTAPYSCIVQPSCRIRLPA